MSAFERSVKRLLGVEGDFSDHPDDSGGATRWGVTEFLAREHGYQGAMRDYPLDRALHVYRVEFWDRMRLDRIAGISEAVAYELFECEVNTPFGTAPTILQRVLNCLNQGGTLYPDLKVDGRIGPKTIDALGFFHAHRGAEGMRRLLAALNGLQACHYTALTERRAKDEAFYYGWLDRVIA